MRALRAARRLLVPLVLAAREITEVMATTHQERITTRVQATCTCHEGFYGYGATKAEAIEALQRLVESQEAMRRAQTKVG